MCKFLKINKLVDHEPMRCTSKICVYIVILFLFILILTYFKIKIEREQML